MTETSKPPAPAIPSATVLVVRDAPIGLEVFMLVRNRMVDFASGALVFPGGKVDAQDRAPAWSDIARTPPAAIEPAIGLCALRETFEETGLLLADDADGRPVDAATATRITHAEQRRVARGERTFADVLQSAALRPALGRLLPFAHWITPASMPKRFDTHFLLAEAPSGQTAEHDGGETVESAWITPLAALAEAKAGLRVIVPATALNLEKLAKSRTVAEAFAAARADTIVTIMPTVTKADGGVVISIPGGAGYDTTSVFMPRPQKS